MNPSAEEVAEVPPGVVIVRSTVPADSKGDVTLQLVADEQLTKVAPVPPKLAVVLPGTKPVPETVTAVPPLSGPTLGLMAVTLGITSYVNWSAEEIEVVPPGVVTVRSTMPAEPEGALAVHEVVDEQLTAVAGFEPNLAELEPTTKPVPVTLTTVPPTSGPALGLMAETLGTGS